MIGLTLARNILGINVAISETGDLSANGNVALFTDGQPVLAIAEERLTRAKHDGGISTSLKLALTHLASRGESLDAIAATSYAQPTERNGEIARRIEGMVRDLLPQGVGPEYFYVDSHHEAHALTAAAQAGNRRALVVVMDHTGSLIGRGDLEPWSANPLEQTTYYLLENGKLAVVDRDHDEPGAVGLGRMFSKVTRYIGLGSYHEAGKTMGLSAFGDPSVFGDCELWEIGPTGKLIGDMTRSAHSVDGLRDLEVWFEHRGHRLPGRRLAGAVVRPVDMHLAAWLQDQVQRFLLLRITQLVSRFNVSAVCLAGGIALNSVCNAHLSRGLSSLTVHIPPSPADAGIGLGAALKLIEKESGTVPTIEPCVYGGPEYDLHALNAGLRLASHRGYDVTACADPESTAVELLSVGSVVGWFQGRSEYGPRALGNRSILANPANHWTKEILNHQLKRREWFRPFAPSVRVEDVDELFEDNWDAPYMMKVARVRKSVAPSIASGVHVDGTARMQTVSRGLNTSYHQLISEFRASTGIPAVLNTSFNLAGQPIVETAVDAVDCYSQANGIDALIIGNYLIRQL